MCLFRVSAYLHPPLEETDRAASLAQAIREVQRDGSSPLPSLFRLPNLRRSQGPRSPTGCQERFADCSAASLDGASWCQGSKGRTRPMIFDLSVCFPRCFLTRLLGRVRTPHTADPGYPSPRAGVLPLLRGYSPVSEWEGWRSDQRGRRWDNQKSSVLFQQGITWPARTASGLARVYSRRDAYLARAEMPYSYRNLSRN